MNSQGSLRMPLLFLGILSLITAVWLGLQRMGWNLPLFSSTLTLSHGQLMFGGFFGTVIGLERAVVIKRFWGYFAPVSTGLGAILILIYPEFILGPILITVGSIFLLAIFWVFLSREINFHMIIMATGALVWLIGNILWLFGLAVPVISVWWMGFLIITIAGERLELSRILNLTHGKKVHFLLGIVLLISGMTVTIFNFEHGLHVVGFGMIVLSLWLFLHDLAKKSVKQAGLARFIAVALLIGYAWLGIGGVLAFFNGGQQAGLPYDALIHSVGLGFVFSMILGHAPIIFPAILKVRMTFRVTYYIPLIVLHASLFFRVAADHAGWLQGRMWGGMLNGIAILLFLANTITSIRSESK